VSILLEIRIDLLAIIVNDVRVTDGKMFFFIFMILFYRIFVFILAHIMRINYMEAPKDFLMSNGKMVTSFHDLDFLESNSNENIRIHLYPM